MMKKLIVALILCSSPVLAKTELQIVQSDLSYIGTDSTVSNCGVISAFLYEEGEPAPFPGGAPLDKDYIFGEISIGDNWNKIWISSDADNSVNGEPNWMFEHSFRGYYPGIHNFPAGADYSHTYMIEADTLVNSDFKFVVGSERYISPCTGIVRVPAAKSCKIKKFDDTTPELEFVNSNRAAREKMVEVEFELSGYNSYHAYMWHEVRDDLEGETDGPYYFEISEDVTALTFLHYVEHEGLLEDIRDTRNWETPLTTTSITLDCK